MDKDLFVFFRGRLAQVLPINRVDILDTYIERKGRQCVRWINKSPSSKATSSSLFVSSKKTRMIAGYHHWLSKSVTGLSFFLMWESKSFHFPFRPMNRPSACDCVNDLTNECKFVRLVKVQTPTRISRQTYRQYRRMVGDIKEPKRFGN